MSQGDARKQAQSKGKAAAMFVLRIAVVAAIYYVIFRKVDLHEVGPLLTPYYAAAMAGAVLLSLLQAAICTIRWMLLARDGGTMPGFVPSFAAYMEGLFFNQALPSFVGGDAVRIMRWRKFGVGTHRAVVSVFRDRMFGAIGAAIFALVASTMLWALPVERVKVIVSFGLGISALCAGAGIMVLIQSRRVTNLFARFHRVHSLLARISGAPLGIPRYALATFYSLFGQLLAGLAVLLLARSLGISLPVPLLVAVTGIIVVASMIPISFAGWGIREAGFLALLVPLGVASSKAVFLGISFGLAGLLAALAGGISMLLGMARPKSRHQADTTTVK
jgi:uncharacterized protein (TIRG00374 family)